MRALLIVLTGLFLGGTALGSAAAPAPLPAPPPMPAAAATPSAPTSTSAPPPAGAVEAPKSRIEPGSNAESAPGELGEPSALEQMPPAHAVAPDTRIEQIRQGNRVAEIRVTPAGSSRSYVIVTREPSRQQSLQDSGTGLSTPHFVRIEF